ncbi:hypothetical protein pb186bvf_019910 [Paramecium bursaria]
MIHHYDLESVSQVESQERYVCYFDGGGEATASSKINAHLGVAIGTETDQFNPILQRSIHLGIKTSNQAEFLAALCGVRIAIQMNIKQLVVKGDSQLVIFGLNGKYKIQNEGLLPIQRAIQNYQQFFDYIDFQFIERKYNTIADGLSRKAK